MDAAQEEIAKLAAGMLRDLRRGGMVTVGFPGEGHKEIVMAAIEIVKDKATRPIEIKIFPKAAIVRVTDYGRPI